MEARKSPGSHVVEVPRELEPEDLDEEARVYGSRWVEVETADGGTRVEEVPLFWKDLFDPQEGDWLMHGPEHADLTSDTKARLKCLFKARGRDDVVVYYDVRMDWKTPGVAPVCPDVAVIPGMTQERSRKADVFDEEKEGTSPWFVLEVTSKTTARYDRTSKPAIYRQAKVPEIFLLDRMKSPWVLSGERRNPQTRRYLKVRPDKHGRLLAESLGVYWSVSASGDELILEDAETGEVLRKPVEESEARRAAERQAAEQAEAREAAVRQAAEQAEARQKEAEAREAAEQQAAEQAEAREVAERQAAEQAEAREAAERQAAEQSEARQQEAEAREAAEQQAAEQAEAREAAEQQAAEQAEARAAAEATVQALLAKIQRLESSD